MLLGLNKLVDVRRFVIHCSATPPSMDIGYDEIRAWHHQRKFSDVGYHAIIRRSGENEWGRSIHFQGAHAAGYNSDSIAICLVGGYDGSNAPAPIYTPMQWAALDRVLHALQQLWPDADVVGHNDLDGRKACPSFDVNQWVKARRF